MDAQPNPSPQPAHQLSKSSRWNLIFMKRTNRVAIAVFVIGIVAKLIHVLVRD